MVDTVSKQKNMPLLNIGGVLLMCQLLERPLDMFCELASASVLTVDLLDSLDAEKRRKTVGQMLKRLRESVDVDPELDGILQSFLEHRNEFVHRLENDDRNMDTPQGRQELARFVSTLLDEVGWLMLSLPGLLLAWSRVAGLEDVFMRTYGALPDNLIEMLDRYKFRPKA